MVRSAEKSFTPQEMESRVQALWRERDAYRLTRDHRKGGKPWYFIDGPPYATGHIHLGTAWNKSIKDSILRYRSMRGYRVRDQPGFDMHGLPIEVKVEKELGIANKQAIEDLGIDRFVNECRTFAVTFKDAMTEEFKELGIWMDWDNPYMTIRNGYIEAAWWAIRRMHERNLLFESERVLTWCRRCETALAAAEIEYADETDPSIYVKFPVVRDGAAPEIPEFIVIWTTTPWTLPANVAVAAHPDLPYVRMEVTRGDTGAKEVLIVAEACAEEVAKKGRSTDFRILETVTGKDLDGLRYEHPFVADMPFHAEPPHARMHTVILGEHVGAERTGLVHTATGHGVEDFDAGAKVGIPPYCPVGEDGRYTAEAGAFEGKPVKGEDSVEPEIEARLKERGLLLRSRPESHSVGHCWRCKTPVIFRATTQWFVSIDPIKQTMLDETARVEWTPDWAGSARQRDWVKNARDWCISRQRYWGIPIPVWKCEDGCQDVLGSRADLEARKPEGYEDAMDLHRPWVDKVTFPCEAHGKPMTRVEDVLDVWFDSAVAGWADLDFPSNREEFELWWPCDFIVEGLDQTRGWFYSQLAAGVASHGRVPYESVLMHGFVHDEKGVPMSKSIGNIVAPHEVIVKHGADAFRFYVLSVCAPWEDIHFSWTGVANTARTFNILWNVHVFATQYMSLDNWAYSADAVARASFSDEDRWMRSRTQSLIRDVTAALDRYELHKATRAIEGFILNDLSRWYVRLSRDRVWLDANDPSKEAAYVTLHEALSTVARLLAPFSPHIVERMYEDLDGKQVTVHMEDWPVADDSLIDADLETGMGLARDVVEAAAFARQKANMKLRWPVKSVTLATDDASVAKALQRFTGLIQDQVNAKEMQVVGGEWEGLELEAVPNKSTIGRAFRQDGPKVVQHLAALDAATLRDMRAKLQGGGSVTVDAGGIEAVLTSDVVTFQTRVPESIAGGEFPGGAVYIDTEVTDAIKAEGMAREVVRRVQETRKEANLSVDARIRTDVQLDAATAATLAPFRDMIAEETRSDAFQFVTADPAGTTVTEWDVEGESIRVGIRAA